MRLQNGLRAGLKVWVLVLVLIPSAWADVDQASWDELLTRHVRWIDHGHASVVDYAGLTRERATLERYLAMLSAVDAAAFDHWSKKEQLAFLVNAYNAFTVQLILSRYPDLSSIKDLGGLFQSPWKKTFVPLLGQTHSLDDIEHGLIRGSGRYRDPRIHFAVNCASIGCPALRPEAYATDRLEAQLEDQARRFLGDRSRNRFADGRLIVSPIFKWYREDFEQEYRGVRTLPDFLARYARALELTEVQAKALREGHMDITFGDYDWRLNDGTGQRP